MSNYLENTKLIKELVEYRSYSPIKVKGAQVFYLQKLLDYSCYKKPFIPLQKSLAKETGYNRNTIRRVQEKSVQQGLVTLHLEETKFGLMEIPRVNRDVIKNCIRIAKQKLEAEKTKALAKKMAACGTIDIMYSTDTSDACYIDDDHFFDRDATFCRPNINNTISYNDYREKLPQTERVSQQVAFINSLKNTQTKKTKAFSESRANNSLSVESPNLQYLVATIQELKNQINRLQNDQKSANKLIKDLHSIDSNEKNEKKRSIDKAAYRNISVQNNSLSSHDDPKENKSKLKNAENKKLLENFIPNEAAIKLARERNIDIEFIKTKFKKYYLARDQYPFDLQLKFYDWLNAERSYQHPFNQATHSVNAPRSMVKEWGPGHPDYDRLKAENARVESQKIITETKPTHYVYMPPVKKLSLRERLLQAEENRKNLGIIP